LSAESVATTLKVCLPSSTLRRSARSVSQGLNARLSIRQAKLEPGSSAANLTVSRLSAPFLAGLLVIVVSGRYAESGIGARR